MASLLWVCMLLGTISLISGRVIRETHYQVDPDTLPADVNQPIIVTEADGTPVTDVPITLAPASGHADNTTAAAGEEGPIEMEPEIDPKDFDVDLKDLKDIDVNIKVNQHELHRRSVENPPANDESVPTEVPPVLVPTVAPANEENVTSIVPVVAEVPVGTETPSPTLSPLPVPSNNNTSSESLESLEMEEVEIVFVIPAANHTGNSSDHHHHPSSESLEDNANGVHHVHNHTHSHSVESSEEDQHPHIAHIFFFSSLVHLPAKENNPTESDVKVEEPELVSKI